MTGTWLCLATVTKCSPWKWVCRGVCGFAKKKWSKINCVWTWWKSINCLTREKTLKYYDVNTASALLQESCFQNQPLPSYPGWLFTYLLAQMSRCRLHDTEWYLSNKVALVLLAAECITIFCSLLSWLDNKLALTLAFIPYFIISVQLENDLVFM